jgi:hypothetical protein
VAVQAGMNLAEIDAAIEANRPRAARLLALIGLQDDEFAADLRRLNFKGSE